MSIIVWVQRLCHETTYTRPAEVPPLATHTHTLRSEASLLTRKKMPGIQPVFRQVRYQPEGEEGKGGKVQKGPQDPYKFAATPLYLRYLRNSRELFQEEQSSTNQPVNISGAGFAAVVIILAAIWVIAGIAAFFSSLVCFGRSGSITEKILGILLAWIIGPFYWFYYAFNKSYCNKNSS